MADEKKDGATGETPGEPSQNQTPENKPLTLEEVQKLIQSETDKIRTKSAQEKKALADELETLKKEKMTEKEKADYELKSKIKEIEDRENQLKTQTLSLKKLNLLKDNTSLLDLEEFITGEDEEQIKTNMDKLKSKFDLAVQKEVEKRFRENGREVTTTQNNNLDALSELKKQYSEALKSGNTFLTVTLQNQIWELERNKK